MMLALAISHLTKLGFLFTKLVRLCLFDDCLDTLSNIVLFTLDGQIVLPINCDYQKTKLIFRTYTISVLRESSNKRSK